MIPQKYTNSTLEAARHLISEGLNPIPVPAGYKGPNRPEDKGWPDKTWAVGDFKDGDNIGIHLTNIAMADKDCDEARALDGTFLPDSRKSGRKSEPRSHSWYRVQGDVKGRRLVGIDGKVLIELRAGKGNQTLVPPSVHPDYHEPYVTYNEDTPIATISATDLERGVRLTAATAQIARCYPDEGGRHYFGLYLAGFLLRNGESSEDVYRIMLEARRLKGPLRSKTELEILKVINSTAAGLSEGKNIAGGPSLKENYDEKLPGKLANLLAWKKTDWSETGQTEDRRNQADRLIQYALDAGVPLFVDQFQVPHTLIEGEAVPLDTRAYNWLRGVLWEKEGRSVNGEALKTAAGTLGAFASASGDVRELYTRAAYIDDVLYYQLGTGRVVAVDKSGWLPVEDPPVVFRSIPNLKPLPDPVRPAKDADLEQGFKALDNLVNLKSGRDKRLFRAYVVTLPLEHVQRYIFQPTGVMGSGKSTTSRSVKRLWDPTTPETVRIDPRDFIQKASHSFVVMLDNQNSLPEWAVDLLCRLVTGEGDSKRKHYTDDDDVIYELKRAVILNGINAPTDRGDAQDRTLPIELDRIPDGVRRAEGELWAEFEESHGKVLGAAFTLLSQAMAKRPDVKLTKRPRLVDWGYYAASVYEVLGWGTAKFEADWRAVVNSQNRETLEGSALAQAILAIMEVHDMYSATADKLLEALETEADKLKIDLKRDKKWPKSPTWVYRRIREILPSLNASGVAVERDRDNSSREITFSKGEPPDDDPKKGDSRRDSRSDSDSKTGDAVTDAVTDEAAEVSQPKQKSGKSDSSDSISGGKNHPLTSEGEGGGSSTEDAPTPVTRKGSVPPVTAVTTEEGEPPKVGLEIGGEPAEGDSWIEKHEDGTYTIYAADNDGVAIALWNLNKQAERAAEEVGERLPIGFDIETTILTPEEGGRVRLIQLSCRKVTCIFDCDYVDATPLLEAFTKNEEQP